MMHRRELAALAGILVGILCITALTLLAVTGWSSPIAVDPRSLEALLAWSTFAMTIGTFLLLAAAVWAGLRVGRQIRVMEGQIRLMEDANEAAILPWLEIKNVGFSQAGDIVLLLASAGSGAATRPRFRAWTVPFDAEPARPYSLAIPDGLAEKAPHYDVVTGAMPPSPEGHYLRDRRNPDAPTAWVGEAGCLVVVLLEYRDLRDTKQAPVRHVAWARKNADGTAGSVSQPKGLAVSAPTSDYS